MIKSNYTAINNGLINELNLSIKYDKIPYTNNDENNQ